MAQAVHITLRSRNVKTGPIPVTTTGRASCPPCPFKKNGCYGDSGPLALHWDQVSDGRRDMGWEAVLEAIAGLPLGQLWRHNQVGDLPRDGADIDTDLLARLVAANRGRRGFTYTHHEPRGRNRAAIAAANDAGFTINLSANSLEHADELSQLGIGPVVTVLPHDFDARTTVTPAGRRVAQCPATYMETDCARCGLCAVSNRAVIVGFPAHGTSWRKVELVLSRPALMEAA